MTRSILAVVTGFLLIASLSFGTDYAIRAAMPDLFNGEGRTTSITVLVLTIGYVGLYATIGCYLTARMAPRHPMRHALVLGALGLVFNMIGTWVAWSTAPVWYHAVSLGLVMVWAWTGGRMREQEVAATSRSTIAI